MKHAYLPPESAVLRLSFEEGSVLMFSDTYLGRYGRGEGSDMDSPNYYNPY